MKALSNVEQFSIGKIIAYHLLPGIPILLFAVVFSNPTWGFGLPIFLSLLLAILFGLIPSEIGILIYTVKKQGQKVRDIISFKKKMPAFKTILWAVPFLIFCIFIFSTVAKFEHSLWTIFDWVPEWFRIDRYSTDTSSKSMVYLMLILGFLLNGILGPLVEEIYFRGFLLPRMTRLGGWAPFVNSALFSLYHFFTPWENITRIIAVTPFVYAVWYKQNIYIGMLVHCLLNTGSMVIMSIAILG